MKQHKIPYRPATPVVREQAPTPTRKELEEQTRKVAERIVKNPAKAARVFEQWLKNAGPETKKKNAA
jgi:hypothetical protein